MTNKTKPIKPKRFWTPDTIKIPGILHAIPYEYIKHLEALCCRELHHLVPYDSIIEMLEDTRYKANVEIDFLKDKIRDCEYFIEVFKRRKKELKL